jgi:hypothetical protein
MAKADLSTTFLLSNQSTKRILVSYKFRFLSNVLGSGPLEETE